MYNTLRVEEKNVPAVGLVNRDFGIDASSAASGKGMPTARILLEDVPPECTVPEEIDSLDVVIDKTRMIRVEESDV